MQLTTEQIEATFAPETHFNIPTRPASGQDEAIALPEALAVAGVAPSAALRFEMRGVPTSPLHD